MTTLREAAQQALEALEQDNPGGRSATITALRAALAQEDQPTRAQQMRDAGYTRRPTLREMAQEEQEQEPMAWIHRKHYMLGHAENMPPADRALALGWEPLYTHPPRREWQSLSKEEVWSQYQTLWPFHPAEEPRLAADIVEFARAIEAALKEKNND